MHKALDTWHNFPADYVSAEEKRIADANALNITYNSWEAIPVDTRRAMCDAIGVEWTDKYATATMTDVWYYSRIAAILLRRYYPSINKGAE